MTTTKTNPGNFFEDFALGQTLRHATPRTITQGDAALYQALYPNRFAPFSAQTVGARLGLPEGAIDPLIVFHVAFGKTVPDISLNAVANLGYADLRLTTPVIAGQTITAESDVIGLKQNSNGKSGVVYVRSRAFADGAPVAEWVRWVMVRKRDTDAPAPDSVVPDLPESVSRDVLESAAAAMRWDGLDLSLWGQPHRLSDYAIGERIDHVDGATIEDAEHMMATRLWQNTAKVHFNVQSREDGRRLVYGGHVISLARALSYNGLSNAFWVAGVNGGAHANPAYGGDTVYAWSEVLDIVALETPGAGAMRLRLVAVKNAPAFDFRLRSEDGKYVSDVLLDLDYWALIPR